MARPKTARRLRAALRLQFLIRHEFENLKYNADARTLVGCFIDYREESTWRCYGRSWFYAEIHRLSTFVTYHLVVNRPDRLRRSW